MARFENRTLWEEAASPCNTTLVRRFSSDWRRARKGPPDPAGYLPDDPVQRPAALLALLRADLTLRREAGEPARVEWYLGRFPELPPELLVALVYEEYCVREEAGDAPDPREYETRFPAIASEVRELIDIHEFVDSTRDLLLGEGPRQASVSFPRAGETIAGFRVVEELGRGGMARVFLAEERHLGNRRVALKVTRTGSREPQTLALLQHTHIVPVHSYHVDAATGLHLLCMPYFGRATLADVLAAPLARRARTGAELLQALDELEAPEQPRPRAEGREAIAARGFAQAIAWWGARLAEALQYAHDCGVWHHDIKPSNILVTADATPMLLDFNLAQSAGPQARAAAELGGTLAYMAPEHLMAVGKLAEGAGEHDAAVDGRADLYALGLVLHEALGLAPLWPTEFGGPTSDNLRALAAARAVRIPRRTMFDGARRVPPALAAVIQRCLEPDPADRYSRAAELAADLQAVADLQPLCFTREPEPGRTLKRAWRNRRLLASALGLVGVVTLIFAAQTASLRRESRARLDLESGIRSAAAGEFAAAAAQFAMAFDRASSGSSQALRALAAESDHRKHEALAAGRIRDRAEAFFLKVEPIRFRLITGHGLRSASTDLQAAFAEFKVFGPTPWTLDPELDRLDPVRRARLVDLVNEVLYLWVIASDQPGDADQARRATAVCERALTFARPAEPWLALKARYDPQPPPRAVRVPHGPVAGARACFQWGLLAVLEGHPETALAWFERAVSLQPDRFWYQFALAYHHALYGDAGQAMAHYDAAIALRPESSWARLNRAQLAWSRLGAWERALADLDEVRSRPGSLEPRLLALELGRVAQRLGDFPTAISEYETVIAADETDELTRQARRNRARVMLELGPAGRAQAGQEYDRLLREDPGDNDARFDRALFALKTGQLGAADVDLTHLLAHCADQAHTSSQRAVWLAARAMARLALNQTLDAAHDADLSVRLAPSPGRLRIQRRVAIAAGCGPELDALDPDDVDRLPMGGRALANDLKGAADKVRQSLEHEGPATARRAELSGRMALAAIDSAVGDHPRALAEANQVVALDPQSGDARLLRARLRRRAGDRAGAMAEVAAGLALAPSDSSLQSLRGRLLIEQGSPGAGLAVLDRALAAGAGAPVHAARAQALGKLGRYPESIAAWTLALRDDTEDADAYLGRARGFIQLGRWDPALADLESAIDCSYERPDILARSALAYAACLTQRPNRLSRALALSARAALAQIGK